MQSGGSPQGINLILMTTPHGHELRAEVSDDSFAVKHAKVVNQYTGAIKELDSVSVEALAQALRAKRVYEQALVWVRESERTLKGFGSLTEELGEAHPTLAPHIENAKKQKTAAREMFVQARHFHEHAMGVIDKLADK